MPMRTPLFQRKSGGPAVVISIHHKANGTGAGAGAGPGDAPGGASDDSMLPGADGATDGSGASEPLGDCTCPQCGCVFNPDTGEVSSGQDYSESSDAPDHGTPPQDAGDAPAGSAPSGAGLSDALMQQLKGGA